jgi:hypothetical protein
MRSWMFGTGTSGARATSRWGIYPLEEQHEANYDRLPSRRHCRPACCVFRAVVILSMLVPPGCSSSGPFGNGEAASTSLLRELRESHLGGATSRILLFKL